MDCSIETETHTRGRGVAVHMLLPCVALSLFATAIAPPVDAQSNPCTTPVGQTCIERWISEASRLLNAYNGSAEFNGRKPWSFSRYGTIQASGGSTTGPFSPYAPDDFPQYGNSKYCWMWAHYAGSTITWLPEAYYAHVPDLQPYVDSCVSGGTSPVPPPVPPTRPSGVTLCYQVDWCLHWGSECGKPAADEYCRRTGHAGGALSFHTAPMRPTVVMGDNRICDQPICNGFTDVTCADGGSTTPPPPPPPPGANLAGTWTLHTQCTPEIAVLKDKQLTITVDDPSTGALAGPLDDNQYIYVCPNPKRTQAWQQAYCGTPALVTSLSSPATLDLWIFPCGRPGNGCWQHPVELKADIPNHDHATRSLSGTLTDHSFGYTCSFRMTR